MAISAGLVGLPNVGKSTLFNALTKSSVPAENYPFCTINPHVACTHVPDIRIEKLKELYHSQKTIPSTVQFVDIAGLVKGAASGEGLGNQFLTHIREVNLILHVLRCFQDMVTPDERDPLGDFEIICTELMLKDLESVTKRLEKANSLLKGRKGDPKVLKELEQEILLLNNLAQALNAGNIAKVQSLLQETSVETVPLLCSKDFLIIANFAEEELSNKAYEKNTHYKNLINKFGPDKVIPVSARLEYELSILTQEEEKAEMRSLMGITEDNLGEVIKKTYKELNLITFFTCGPQEIHAWPLTKGSTIRQAAGEIHSDLERGFICADVFNSSDLLAHKSLVNLKEAGKIRTVGQEYLVEDGDVIHVKFNV